MRRGVRTLVVGLAAVLLLAGGGTRVGAENVALPDDSFTLADQCPPGFGLVEGGVCRLASLYDLYASKDDHGGLRVKLPDARQGFTPQQIDLGRHLFFDPILSGGGDMSCSSCHDPDKGLSDGRATAMGHGGKPLSRRSPTLWNVGFLKSLFWDGRADSLEKQAEGPLLSPQEMNGARAGIEAALNANRHYRRMFAQAFGDVGPIAFTQVATALTAFQSTLISLNSRYDRYAHGDQDAMTPLEINGMNVFRGFVARCSQCHTPPLFTNGELAVVGAPPTPGQPLDLGAGAVSDDPTLRGAFKVPTLRNVTVSGPPYFHAGQFTSLSDAARFYNDRRGHALPPGEHQTIHWHVHMQKAELGEADVAAIVAFLGALEDETAKPQRPRLLPSKAAP